MQIVLFILIFIDVLFSIGILALKLVGHLKNEQAYQSIEDNAKENVLVILPIRGTDFEIDKNIKSLQEQDYANYKIVAVVDRDDEIATKFVMENNLNFIFSDSTCENCSGKVKAIHSALIHYDIFDAYVIADSDVRANNDWLTKLVTPLKDTSVGISTTFPTFFPRGKFWSHFKMYWGIVGKSMMESDLTRFAWGGSLGFRKDLMNNEDLKFFSTFISDDVALLKICKSKNLKVKYVKDAGATINSNDNFTTFIEWSNRQTALSISSDKRIFTYGIIYYFASIFLILTALAMAFVGYWYFILFLIPFIIVSIDNLKKVPLKSPLFLLYSLLMNFVYMYNLIAAKRMKSISWRGKDYSLKT